MVGDVGLVISPDPIREFFACLTAVYSADIVLPHLISRLPRNRPTLSGTLPPIGYPLKIRPGVTVVIQIRGSPQETALPLTQNILDVTLVGHNFIPAGV